MSSEDIVEYSTIYSESLLAEELNGQPLKVVVGKCTDERRDCIDGSAGIGNKSVTGGRLCHCGDGTKCNGAFPITHSDILNMVASVSTLKLLLLNKIQLY